MDRTAGSCMITPPSHGKAKPVPKQFTFDAVYDWNSNQQEIYDETAAPIVESCLEGYNGTIFAYGQTGSGKTWTMTGMPSPDLQGIIPNSFQHIFDRISLQEETQFLVRASYLEIYQEDVRDLLGGDPNRKLMLKGRPGPHGEEEVYVPDLTSFLVKGVKEIEKVMSVGMKNRHVGSTDMNDKSSRSHAVFTITIESACTGPDGEPAVKVGKLNLVDLAGSERQEKTHAEGERLREGAKINLSLSALCNVISALVDAKATHIPFRDSKLTRLLQNSLGGSCRTVMIANISPADYNYQESISTLRYADRAKQIKNKPRVNMDPKDALLAEYQQEIKKLREMLEARRLGLPVTLGPGGAAAVPTIAPEALMEQLKKQNEEEIEAILKEKGYAAEEISKIKGEVKEAIRRGRQERKERLQLEKKLQMMEEKLIGGARSLIDENERQQALIRQNHLELEQKKLKEMELQRRLQERREKAEILGERLSDNKRELERLTRKLKILYSKYTLAKQEVSDIQEEFQEEKDGLLETIREQTSQLKLGLLIMSNFIPREESEKVESRIIYDEENETYVLQPLDDRQTEAPLFSPRPSASHADRARKADSLLSLNLDMPSRTTQDFSSPRPCRLHLQAALKEVEEDKEAVSFRASENLPNVYLSGPREVAQFESSSGHLPSHSSDRSRKNLGRLRSNSEPPPPDPSLFPSARGTVGRSLTRQTVSLW